METLVCDLAAVTAALSRPALQVAAARLRELRLSGSTGASAGLGRHFCLAGIWGELPGMNKAQLLIESGSQTQSPPAQGVHAESQGGGHQRGHWCLGR